MPNTLSSSLSHSSRTEVEDDGVDSDFWWRTNACRTDGFSVYFGELKLDPLIHGDGGTYAHTQYYLVELLPAGHTPRSPARLPLALH